MGNARGQISIEYLIIVGITLGILIPAVFFFYTYSKSGTGSTTSAQVNDIGLRTISSVKSAYALGNGAWQTIEFIMPDTVTRVYVNGTELVFLYDTAAGESSAVFFSSIQLNSTDTVTGNISTPHAGPTKYRLTSKGTYVLITEVT